MGEVKPSDPEVKGEASGLQPCGTKPLGGGQELGGGPQPPPRREGGSHQQAGRGEGGRGEQADARAAGAPFPAGHTVHDVHAPERKKTNKQLYWHSVV